jgi:hypothetical protein
MLASVKTLLSSIVDYAGLFPPAKLPLHKAMASYVDHQLTPYNWMLNRFVLSTSQLKEFEALQPTFQLKQWPLTLIFSKNWELEIEMVRSLYSKNQLSITALEFPQLSSIEIQRIIPNLVDEVEVFFEIPFSVDLQPYLTVLKNTQTSAKIRTGGITIDTFPSANQLCQYILSFANAQIPFKATAGLHHLLPGNYCITYEPDSPSTQMHGFLNVIVLAALVYWQKITPQTSLELLQESASKNFHFTDDAISWRNYRLNIAEIEEARQRFFRSFGSCSFQEPVNNLKYCLPYDSHQSHPQPQFT